MFWSGFISVGVYLLLEYIYLGCEDGWNSFAKAAETMSSPTHHQPAETFTPNGKRQRPDEVKERMLHLKDAELLECPICFKYLQSPPIYQCANGHVACSACCEKLPQGKKCPTCSQPTGKLRCIFLEKILASMQLICKYAPHGCDYKLWKMSDSHEKDCRYAPFPCLFPGCVFEGTRITTPEHLTNVHQVPTVEYNIINGAAFTMKPSDRIAMVKLEGLGDWRDDQTIFVHREPRHRKFHGDVFFCTSETYYGYPCVDLKVAYKEYYDYFHSARLNTISFESAGEYLKNDFLLLPLGSLSPDVSGAERNERLTEVHLKVPSPVDYANGD